MLRRLFHLALTTPFIFSLCSVGAGAEPWARIEEDWELRLNQPDAKSNSPQLTIILTPHTEHLATYFQLQLNHAADSTFSGGGFRVSAFANDSVVEEARSDTRQLLTIDGDVIQWTSVMAEINGQLLFAIKDGSSLAWGEFGGPEYLLRLPSGDIQDLSGYTPMQSIKDVDIGFGRNRIQSLTLKRVRAYRADGSMIAVETALDAF